MDAANLVHMANRIGQFFAALPDRQEARHGIADHLRKFWDPRMRRRLLEHVDQAAAPVLDELVGEALAAHRERILPPSTGPLAPHLGA